MIIIAKRNNKNRSRLVLSPSEDLFNKKEENKTA